MAAPPPMTRCHVCDHEVPPDDVRWMLPFMGTAPSDTTPLVSASRSAHGALPTCAWCAQSRLANPTRQELDAARESLPDRLEAYRECGRQHSLAEMATVGLEFCTECLTTFAYGKPVDPPTVPRRTISLPQPSAKAGDLLILEDETGAFGVYRLTDNRDRELLEGGCSNLVTAWEAARKQLQYETRLWVGRTAEPEHLQLY